MPTIYRDFPQNTTYGHRARMGMATASCFKLLGAKGRGAEASKSRDRYLYECAAELIYGRHAHHDISADFPDLASRAVPFAITEPVVDGAVRKPRPSPPSNLGNSTMHFQK